MCADIDVSTVRTFSREHLSDNEDRISPISGIVQFEDAVIEVEVEQSMLQLN